MTSAPYPRAAAATSRPIQPAPGDDQVAVVPAEGGQHAPQPLGVGEAAQVVDAGQVGARDVEAARLGAGGQQQLVVVDAGAVAEADGLGGAVEWRRRSGRGAARCRRCAYQAGSWTKTLSRSSLPSEIALGQRRAFVGVVALVADQDHPAGETLRTQRLGGFRPGQPPPTMTNVRCASTT